MKNKFWVSNPKFQVLEMYNMLLEISTELDSIKAMLQKSECTHLLEFQIFCKEGNEIAKILLIIQPNFELLL